MSIDSASCVAAIEALGCNQQWRQVGVLLNKRTAMLSPMWLDSTERFTPRERLPGQFGIAAPVVLATDKMCTATGARSIAE